MKAWKYTICATCIAVTGCTQLVSIRETTPRLAGAINQRLNVAVQVEKTDPRRALGEDLAAASDAYRALMKNPRDDTARHEYNFAVGRVVETVDDEKLAPWNHPVTVPTPNGSMELSGLKGRDADHNPSNYELYVTDTMTIGGKFFPKRMTVEGVGAPLVAVSRETKSAKEAKSAMRRVYGTVTAVVRFEGRRAVLEFHEPLAKETVAMGGHTFPLAADYTAGPALLMAQQRPEKIGLARTLRPEKYADTAKLTRLQAYDPNRIPVIFIHGLQDTPACWSMMLNDLRGQADLRRKYQFWVYSYPAGYPFPYSAALLRDALDGVDKEFPHHKSFVLVGHSMGGLVTRLMVTDAGDKFWLMYFGKPPAETKISGASRNMLEKTLIFNHRTDIHRVVFMSTPHRGSNIATIFVGRIASALIHPPATFRKLQREIFPALTRDPSAMKMNRMPNSVDTLAPNNRFVKTMNQFPIAAGIPYHNIMGDRGRGDTPHSSDGVVPYWSSHLDGAESELIVPSGHGSPQNPQAIAEVERILRKNRE